jgi:pantoate--beta-alanine ligase
MLVCRTISEIRSVVQKSRDRRQTVGFVPTMGYFHEGHLVLMHEAKKVCDLVVVSIFVNPLQFGPREDLDRYPRDFERDVHLAEKVGVDVVFFPSAEEMYPSGFSTRVELGELTQCLCGRSRPGHFQGVATVVAKLFNIVFPDKAFFGQKDAQQVLVIKRMVKDLNMPLEIVVVPTVREEDGVAMSSRNVYLEPHERQAARCLRRSMEIVEQEVVDGERDASRLQEMARKIIAEEPLADIDYVEIRSLPDLKPVTSLECPALLAVAARFGKTRLIDNTVLCAGGVEYVFNHV